MKLAKRARKAASARRSGSRIAGGRRAHHAAKAFDAPARGMRRKTEPSRVVGTTGSGTGKAVDPAMVFTQGEVGKPKVAL